MVDEEEEEVWVEGMVGKIGLVVEEVGVEEVGFVRFVEDVVVVFSVGRVNCNSPGIAVAGRGEGKTTFPAGVGDSREEESNGGQGSSGSVGSAGSGEGVAWETSIMDVGRVGRCPSDSLERATHQPRDIHLHQ